jgi:hypothetical protein
VRRPDLLLESSDDVGAGRVGQRLQFPQMVTRLLAARVRVRGTDQNRTFLRNLDFNQVVGSDPRLSPS